MVVETGELSGCLPDCKFPTICRCENLRKCANILIDVENNELDFLRSKNAFHSLCLGLDYYA